MSLANTLLYAVELYVAAGICVAIAFAIFGVTRVVPMTATIGARLLFMPGAAALWPYVLYRWFLSGRRP